MPRVHTHYDNLKVTRNAPPEVIRAAYKSLSQKFHPDRNPDDPTATRTFQIINTAYEVLSDPQRRRDHDDWITVSESETFAQDEIGSPAGPGPGFGPPGRGAPAAARPDWRQAAYLHSSMRRFRPVVALRQASGYLFLSAVATLVLLGIMLG